MKMISGRIKKVGVNAVSERTDPDYLDKRLATMKAEFESLKEPAHKEMFANGLSDQDWKSLQEMGCKL